MYIYIWFHKCDGRIYSSIYKYNYNKRLNSIRTWCKTHVLPLQSQHATSFYHIFKNKYNCGAQVIYGPGPFTRGESRGPSRGGLWPKPDKIKPEKSLGYIQGLFGPRQDLKSHRSEGQKGYRTKLERASKISRESCPYCHSILCT